MYNFELNYIIIVILMPRIMYIGGMLNIFFFFDDHTASFKIITRIFTSYFDKE